MTPGKATKLYYQSSYRGYVGQVDENAKCCFCQNPLRSIEENQTPEEFRYVCLSCKALMKSADEYKVMQVSPAMNELGYLIGLSVDFVDSEASD